MKEDNLTPDQLRELCDNHFNLQHDRFSEEYLNSYIYEYLGREFPPIQQLLEEWEKMADEEI